MALFAALSYAVTQTGRGNGTTAKEQAALGAARIMNQAALIDSTVMRLMLANNVKVEYLHFENNASMTGWGLPANGALGSPADPALYLFDPRGGGVPAQLFTNLSVPCPTCNNSALVPGHFFIGWGNIEGIGTSTADLLFSVYYLSDAVCREINNRLGISGIPVIRIDDYPPGSAGDGTPPPVLGYPVGAGKPAVLGKQDYCANWHLNGNSVNTGNVFFHALVIN